MVSYSENLKSQILSRIEYINVLKPCRYTVKIEIIPGRDLFDFRIEILELIFKFLTIQDLITISMVSHKSRSLLNPYTTGYEIWKSGFDMERDLQSKINLLNSIFKNDLPNIPHSKLWEKYRSWLGFPDPSEIGLSDREFFHRYFNQKCTYCDQVIVYKIWEWSGVSFCEECFKTRTKRIYKPYQQESVNINSLFYSRLNEEKSFPEFGKAVNKSKMELLAWLEKEAGIKRSLKQPFLINYLLDNIPDACKTTLIKCPGLWKALNASADTALDLKSILEEVSKDMKRLKQHKLIFDFKLKLLAAKPKNILDDEILTTEAFTNASETLSGLASTQDLNQILADAVNQVVERRRRLGLAG